MTSIRDSLSPVQILIVEDNPGDAFLISHLLGEIEGLAIEPVIAGSLAEADGLLKTRSFALIFSDMDLPDARGLETVARIKDNPQDAPVIVLTGYDDRELAREAIRLGAQDFLEKSAITGEALGRLVTHSLERHSRDRALHESLEEMELANRRFVQMVGDLTDAVVVFDPDRTILFVNRAMEQMFEKSASELVGSRFEVAGDTREPVEIELAGRSGVERIAEVRVVETEWDNKPARIASLRDITERKRAEQAMLMAQHTAETANEMKSRFLANMSHELRTPLNSIIGFSEIISNETLGEVGNAQYRDYARDIHQSGHHLLSLINDLLDLSKAEANRYEIVESEFDIVETIEEVVRLVAPQALEKAQTIEVRPEFVDCRVWAGERQMTQVLVNLLSNAIKFTPESGRIEVRVRRTAQGALVVDVADSGIGIEPEEISKLFHEYTQVGDPYLKTESQGTGLGLALSKRLVELHGGFIRMESEPGAGTTVSIVLPNERLRGAELFAPRAAVG